MKLLKQPRTRRNISTGFPGAYAGKLKWGLHREVVCGNFCHAHFPGGDHATFALAMCREH